jgi:hypothetical protein
VGLEEEPVHVGHLHLVVIKEQQLPDSTSAPENRLFSFCLITIGKETVLGIRNRMFLGLPDPHPDPLVTSTDPAQDPAPDPTPDPSIIKQK